MSGIRPDFYKVMDLELTSIADAIRSVAGTSNSLTFPSDFIDEIDNINSIRVNDYLNRNYTSITTNAS